MKSENFQELIDFSKKVRLNILEMARNGGCFIGAAFSCVEIIVYLYKKFLNISLENLKEKDRDYFFLSKGHAVPSLYGTFIELGWLNKTRLNNYLTTKDNLYWHPNTEIEGIDFHSGSLGHCLSIGTGVAFDIKLTKTNGKVVVLTGDGELNEGSNWEALLVASSYKLDNLIIIVDRNRLQANVKTETLIQLEPLEEKFRAFNCGVKRIDGHNFDELEQTFSLLPFEQNKPNVIIAETIRGKSIPEIEGRPDKWFCHLNEDEFVKYSEEIKKS